MEQRSIGAYENWREAATRFDYFVLGFIAALTAYIGQSFRPTRLVWAINSANLELLSLALLVSAVVAGFKRAETNVEIFRLNHEYLHSLEGRGAMAEVLRNPAPAFNAQTGDPVPHEHAAARYSQLGQRADRIQQVLDQAASRSLRMYKLRNWLFAAGFVSLVVSRILGAYQPA
jgi:hypothetical protein